MMKNSITIALLSMLALSFVAARDARAQGQSGAAEIECRMLAAGGTASFPFELRGGRIVLAATVNGVGPFRLALDTGMPMDGLLLNGGAKVDSLHLVSSGKSGVMGAGGGKPIEADIVQGIAVGLSGAELTGLTAVVTPYDPTRSRIFDFDGVIGYSIFSRFAVTIDYERKTLTLTEPSGFTGAGLGEELPIHFAGNIPFVNCTAEMESGMTVPLDLAIDTGAGHALSLNVGSREGIELPKKCIDGVVSRGLTKRMTNPVGRVKTLHLGSAALAGVIATFSPEKMHMLEKEGSIGAKALGRFRVTFDYGNQRIFLDPGPRIDEPFEFNMTGAQFVKADEGRLRIERVFPDSPASEAKLAEQDMIVEIEGRPAGDYAADELDRILTREGREIAMTVSRGAEVLRVRLKLRRLI